MPSRRPQHQIFEFTSTALEGRHLRLRYALRGGPDPDVAFEESLWFPDALPAPDPNDPIVVRLIDACHRTFGVSYFKAAIPPVIAAPPVSEADGAFWDELYSIGMGEFYFRNGLDPRGRASFPRGDVSAPPALSGAGKPAGDERALVLIGGGKDSAVAAEIVRHAGVSAAALSLGDSPWIHASAVAAGLEHFVIRRTLDQRLIELNTQGAWNGHIPISACIAAASTLAAYVGGFSDVIVGNERGADDGNLVWEGLLINHQWSKSLAYERSFRAWLDRNAPGAPRYFSLLRPLGEVAIASAFARHKNHFRSFTSCNTNFRQPGSSPADRWCGRCSKCVFVQLCLSPHLTDAEVREIFPHDFLADPANIRIVEELVGVVGVKPWECVGTVSESRLSLTLLHAQGRLAGAAAAWVAGHSDALVDDYADALRVALMRAGPHCLTPLWEQRLDAYLGPST